MFINTSTETLLKLGCQRGPKHQEFMRLPFVLEKILPPHAFEDFEDLDELKWINQRFEKREAESIRCGLQKTVFAYERDRATGRPIEPVVIIRRK
jgi:hypothetical protein